MRIDPALEALRRDPASQRRAQARLEQAKAAWLNQGAAHPVMRDLRAYGQGEALPAAPSLALIMQDADTARLLVSGLVAAILPALLAHPFGLVPFRHQQTAGHGVLELARSGCAALSLMVYRPAAGQAPATVSFASGERHEICLHGRASGRLVRAERRDAGSASLVAEETPILPGWTGTFDNARQTKLVDRVLLPLVMLRLSRDSAQPAPAREYRLTDGGLVHEAAGTRHDSRRELALAVLGSMGRCDALPAICAAAGSGPAHVRWEAVRQALAMDTREGFSLLSGLARRPADDLAAPAAALRAHLLAAHPQLAVLEEAVPCRS